MTTSRISSTLAACLLLHAAGPAFLMAQPVTILAGDIDNFSPGDSVDTTSRRPLFDQWVNQPGGNNAAFHGGMPREFDVVWPTPTLGPPHESDHNFGLTFQGLPPLQSATLEIGLKADAGSAPGNDAIALQYLGDGTTGGFAWSKRFFHGSPGVFSLFNTWDVNDESILTLDLASLPNRTNFSDPPNPLNILPNINATGYLDISIADDTGVDYIKLTYEVAVVPEPSTFALAALGLLGIGWCRRKRV